VLFWSGLEAEVIPVYEVENNVEVVTATPLPPTFEVEAAKVVATLAVVAFAGQFVQITADRISTPFVRATATLVHELPRESREKQNVTVVS
jgi:pilus assembly protein TadC